MITVNRTAIVVLPGWRFLDWLHLADPTSGGLSLEDLQREATNREGVRACLGGRSGEIFEEQLNGWFRMPALWPRRRDLEAFDLCDDPLLRDDM